MADAGPVSCRPATAADEPFLWRMLVEASHAADDGPVALDVVQADPALARYVAGWPRPGDLGVIAVRDGRPVGAAWVRLPVGDEQRSAAFVDADTPELAIAVEPGAEGGGIGTRLLVELLAVADRDYAAVTLNVRADNPAVRLYERVGFRRIGTITNRVGTASVKMLRPRPADA